MRNRYLSSTDLILFAIGLFSIVYFVRMFPHTYPEGSIKGMISSEEAEKAVNRYLQNRWFPQQDGLDTLEKFIELDSRATTAIFLQEEFGLDKAVELGANKVPVFVWKNQWSDVGSSDIQLGSNNNEGDRPGRFRRGLEVRVDGQGRLFSFELRPSIAELPNSSTEEVKSPTLPATGPATIDSARLLAKLFLASVAEMDTTTYVEERVQSSTRQNFTAYDFTFKRKTSVHGLEKSVKVQLTNGLVTDFETVYDTPPSFEIPKDRWHAKFHNIASFLIVILAIVLTAVYFFVRYKRGAFDFKLGLFYGAVVGLAFSFMIGLELYRTSWLGVLIVTVFAGGFYFLTSAILVAVCASLARDAWPEKYQTFEAIRRGRLFNQNSGASLLRGIFWSLIIVGLTTAVLRVIPDASVWFNSKSTGKYHVNAGLFVFSTGLWTSIMSAHMYVLLPLTLVKKRLQGRWILYAVSVLIFVLSPLMFDGSGSLASKAVTGAILALIYTWILVRHDFLTLVTTMFVTFCIQESAFVFLSGDTYALSVVIALFGVVGAVAFLAGFSRQSGQDVLEYVPEYVKELETKQRMQREFEIARQIQDNLLCRTTPSLPDFDIASLCDPAYEVGGDYYDFVNFPDNRVGVVIGDVSGKGVSAAFYMTLAKGILQTQARITPRSTRDTLSGVNDVFYQQIDRGKFISMIYAIFDYDRSIVQLSRAGHNPVLIKKSSDADAESLTTTGMAIGLARGKVFSDKLEEIEVTFKPGDLFVFYTDGFPEARNAAGDEFGEARLSDVIRQNNMLDAGAIVQKVREVVNEFAGKTEQHDDMTMIVVKIK